jgi:hypothetical protein
MNMQAYAIKAFKEGSDNFKEKIVGVKPTIEYNTMKAFGGKDPHYTMVVFLEEDKGHQSTSGIGFYPKNVNGVTKLQPCSGHMLPWYVDITPEIQAELDKAVHTDC